MKRITVLLLVCFLQLAGGRIFGLVAAPYSITGNILQQTTTENEKYYICGTFKNASQKNIKSFTMVFYVFDEDGASPLYARNNVVLKIDEQIPAETKYDFSLNIDKFFYENSDGDYETEYLYVSKIAYEDDTEWTDPLGLEIF